MAQIDLHTLSVFVCLSIGTFFFIVASLGILRMPDIYTRLHVATKAGTVGLGFLLLAVAIYFSDVAATSRAIGAIFFIFLTSPVASHLLGKAMLKKDYKFWQR